MKRLIKRTATSRLKTAGWDDEPYFEWDGDMSHFSKDYLYFAAVLDSGNDVYIATNPMIRHDELMDWCYDENAARLYLTPSEKKIDIENPRNAYKLWQEQNGDEWPTVYEVREMKEYPELVQKDIQELNKKFPGWSINVSE